LYGSTVICSAIRSKQPQDQRDFPRVDLPFHLSTPPRLGDVSDYDNSDGIISSQQFGAYIMADQREIFELAMQVAQFMPQSRENMKSSGLLKQLLASMSVQEEPFIYRAQFLALAPAATQTFNVNIQADADFKILGGAYHANVANAAQTISTYTYPLVDIQLTDTGSGRFFQDNPVSLPAYFGNGQLPFLWPIPKIMRARSTLQVQATNYDAASTYNIRGLYFIGVKMYPLS
jgi:hypothetical protein